MLLERCLLHVGLSAMKGRLEATDTCIKCSGDALFATADATLVLRRWGSQAGQGREGKEGRRAGGRWAPGAAGAGSGCHILS